jgi:hypothetical protein
MVLGTALSAAACAAAIGYVAQRLAGNRMAPWILGRAAGLTAYLLLLLLVVMGLLLSHPWRSRIRRPNNAVRIRVHVVLAVFTAAFTALHIYALATDRYAGVGWRGALVPMGASYRPLATTLGLIGLWAGLLAGLTAAASGRLPLRLWWPIHKVAGLSLVAIWVHGVLGGSDSSTLVLFYLITGAGVLVLAFGRYAARTPSDLAAELPR